MASRVLNTSQYHLKDIALIGLIVAVCIWTVDNILNRWKTKQEATRPSAPDLEKKPLGSKFKKSDRKPGGKLSPRPRLHNCTTNSRQSIKNGHRLPSKDQQQHPIRIGMSIRPSLYRIGRFDMDRKYTAMRFWNRVAHYVRKYFITMGLRSMKWDEWIGETRIRVYKNSCSQKKNSITITSDTTPTRPVASKNGVLRVA